VSARERCECVRARLIPVVEKAYGRDDSLSYHKFRKAVERVEEECDQVFYQNLGGVKKKTKSRKRRRSR
jgi:hypothetical protein